MKGGKDQESIQSSTTSKMKSTLLLPPPDVTIEVCSNLVNNPLIQKTVYVRLILQSL